SAASVAPPATAGPSGRGPWSITTRRPRRPTTWGSATKMSSAPSCGRPPRNRASFRACSSMWARSPPTRRAGAATTSPATPSPPKAGGGRANETRAHPAAPGQAIAPLGANGFNIPSLLSVHETGPYFYSGLAQTLDQVLDGSQDANGGTRHHFVLNAAQRAD